MSSVKNTDDILWSYLFSLSNVSFVEQTSYGFFTALIFFSKIINGLPFPDMFTPNLLTNLMRSSFVLKLFATILAFVMLDVSSLTILLYGLFLAVWTLFLDIACSF